MAKPTAAKRKPAKKLAVKKPAAKSVAKKVPAKKSATKKPAVKKVASPAAAKAKAKPASQQSRAAKSAAPKAAPATQKSRANKPAIASQPVKPAAKKSTRRGKKAPVKQLSPAELALALKDFPVAVVSLIRRGQTTGFITEEDLTRTLPEDNDDLRRKINSLLR